MKRQHGEVRDAIVAFLSKKDRTASTSEIHAAVESALGAPVPRSSVRSYLNLNTRDVFQRVERGQYRLRKTGK